MKNRLLNWSHISSRWLAMTILVLTTALATQAQQMIYVPTGDSLEITLETLDTAGLPLYYNDGDIIILSEPGPYIVKGTVDIFGEVTIKGDPALGKRPELWFYDNGFRLKEDSINVTLMDMIAVGIEPADSTERSNAPYFLRFDQASWFNYEHVLIKNVEASEFRGGVQLWKNQRKRYKSVTLDNVYFHDMLTDFVIDPRLNVVEELKIVNSTFSKVKGLVKNVYNNNDGQQEWGTVAQHVIIDHNTMDSVVTDVLLQFNDNTDGSVTVDFTNNIVSNLYENTNSRPFRINESAGNVKIENSVFFNFETSRIGGFNLDTLSLQSNVTVSGVTYDDPGYKDVSKGSYLLPADSPLQTGGIGGSPVGDPQWAGSSRHVGGGLEAFIENTALWNPGDVIFVTRDELITGTVDIFQEVTIMGDPALGHRPELTFWDNGFRAKEDSISITIKGLKLNGLREDSSKAPYALRFDQAAWYNYNDIIVEDCEIYNFNGGIQLWKNQRKWYDKVVINNVYGHDLLGDFVIDPRLNVVKELEITNSTFTRIKGLVKNVYNDNNSENEWGAQAQSVLIANNTFHDVVTDVFIQLNDGTDGSVTLNFNNNIVSVLSEQTNTRPFRINEAVGNVTISNSIIHDFESSRIGGFNLDTLSLQSNVTVTNVTDGDPGFKDPANGDYSVAYKIGDPEWIAEDPVALLGLEKFIENTALWEPGDVIYVTKDEIITGTVDIFQEVTIMGDPRMGRRPELTFWDNGFRAKEDSISITIKGLKLNGLREDSSKAPYALRFDQAAWHNYNDIIIEDCEIFNFNGGIQLWKNQRKWYDKVIVNNVYAHDLMGDFFLDPRLNVVKELKITNSTFTRIKGLLKNVYNDNNSENEWGPQAQNILVANNTLHDVVTDVLIQLNDGTDGSVTFNFENNIVSVLSEKTNTRPFRINEAVGTVSFKNSVIHDFETSRIGGYNLDTLSLQTNVTVENVTSDDPGFKDPANGSYLLSRDSPLNMGGTNGGPIGDPEWAGDVREVMGDLEAYIENISLWNPGDTIMLRKPYYEVKGSIDVLQSLTVMGDPMMEKAPLVHFLDNGFSVKDDSINVAIVGVDFDGKSINDDMEEHIAPFVLRYSGGQSMGRYDHVILEKVRATGFRGGVDLNPTKQKWYKKVVMNEVFFKDFTGQEWALDPNLNVVEELMITNSTFARVGAVLKNVYFNKDGNDVFGPVPQTLIVDHNTFYKIGSNHNSLIQLNDQNDGQLNFTFSNNIVSGILNDGVGVNANRLLRLNPAAGIYSFENSYFHDFMPADDGKKQYTLDSISVDPDFANAVQVSDVKLNAADPLFVNPMENDFTIEITSPALIADDGTGYIGDPRWIPIVPGLEGEGIHPIPNTPDSLEHFMENISYWEPGDTILLVSPGVYIVNGTIDIFQEVTVLGDPGLRIQPELIFYDNGFRLKEDSISVTLKGFKMNGLREDSSKAPYALRFDQAAWYNYDNILLEDLEIYNFNGGVQLYKNQRKYYKSVVLNRIYAHDLLGDFVIDPRLNVVEDLQITNSTFHDIKGLVKNVYNDNANDREWGVVQQSVKIDHNTIYNAVSDVLLQFNDGTDGSVTVNFTNNIVSKILEPTNSRPFRINEAVGPVTISNSVFHDFETQRLGGYNLDTLSLQSNVTVSDTTSINPEFAKVDARPYNFTLPLSSSLIGFGTDGGPIGDPRWVPEVGITITPLTEAVIELDEVQMEVTASFGEGADKTVTWSVLNGQNGTTGEATISAEGVLTAVKAGEVAVVAVSNFASIYTDTLVVNIEPYVFVESIALTARNAFGTETTEINSKGGALTIAASILPFAAPNKDITWSLSDDNLATFSEINASSINLSAVASGKLTITATADDGSGVTGTIEINITNQAPVTAITVSAKDGVTEVVEGNTLEMIATVEPANADNDSVEWKVSNTSIATIDANGVLTAIAAGKVTVTASATDNSFRSGTLEITVIVPPLSNAPEEIALIYPNPATRFVNVNADARAEVSILNLSGQVLQSKVFETGSGQMQVQSLRSGMYLIRVTQGSDVQTIRFTKQ